MVKHKKCCVCGGTKKKNFFKAPSLENLKSVFKDVSDINEESCICCKCRPEYYRRIGSNVKVYIEKRPS